MEPTAERRYVITLSCPDTTGIVAEISGFLARSGGWIVEAGYHSDPDTGWFFTRQVVLADSLPFDVEELRARFGEVAVRLGGLWTISDTGVAKRAVLLVSKEAHCLHDLLGRVATGELPARLEAVIGNHDGLGDIVRAHGVPFHHVAFPAGGKAEAFAQVRKLVDASGPGRDRARPIHADPAAGAVRGLGRAGAEHPPQLPAVVRRRAAVPPGARPWRQADRRDLPLRHRRTWTRARSSSRT